MAAHFHLILNLNIITLDVFHLVPFDLLILSSYNRNILSVFQVSVKKEHKWLASLKLVHIVLISWSVLWLLL